MARLLFVVHRAYPFPGGSEYYVQNMAEELHNRGHEVEILTHRFMEGKNSLPVSSDFQKKLGDEIWDLIVVHGADAPTQNLVWHNAKIIKRQSPILYLVIKPSDSPYASRAMLFSNYVGYSTWADIQHIKKWNNLDVARRVRHGIVPKNVKPYNFLKRNVIIEQDEVVISSVGGFSSHKGMNGLVRAFENSNVNGHLFLAGYMDEQNAPNETDRIHVIMNSEPDDILSLIKSSDLYVMNSFEEGFGLVLLEAMSQKTPWIARMGVGATIDMNKYGMTYFNESELTEKLNGWPWKECGDTIENAYTYVMQEHTIKQTVDDIEDILING